MTDRLPEVVFIVVGGLLGAWPSNASVSGSGPLLREQAKWQGPFPQSRPKGVGCLSCFETQWLLLCAARFCSFDSQVDLRACDPRCSVSHACVQPDHASVSRTLPCLSIALCMWLQKFCAHVRTIQYASVKSQRMIPVMLWRVQRLHHAC